MALTVSLYAFAAAIPMLTTVLLSISFEQTYTIPELRSGPAFESLGLLTSFVGIASMFFHFSRLAGALFLVLSLLGAVYIIVQVAETAGAEERRQPHSDR